MQMTKINVKINKPIYLSLAILVICETVLDKFWYGYIKPQN